MPAIKGTRKTENLEDLRKEYSQLKAAFQEVESSINASMRELRLKKLSKTVDEILANTHVSKSKKNQREKTAEQLCYERWDKARQRGNEFSQFAKKQLSYEAFEQKIQSTLPSYEKFPGSVLAENFSKIEQDMRLQRLCEARRKGNEYSKLARMQSSRKSKDQKDELRTYTTMVKNYFRTVPYGNYYSARNRLVYKNSVEEYDKEFQQLLLKCALFEREHEEVPGFLQEKIFNNILPASILEEEANDETRPQNPEGRRSSAQRTRSIDSIESIVDSAKFSSSSLEVLDKVSVKEIGVQVAEENLTRSSVRCSESNSLTANTSEEQLTFVDAHAGDFKDVVDKIGDQ